ncbi:MAG: NAD(P)H-binding protein [Cellulophaga sp.]|nr:NAD(P)H-binding protein [Cellulophaga sp.]
MKPLKKSAILLGATGLTGRILLDLLLKDDVYEKIKLFSRTSIGFTHPKIEEHLIDLLQLENYGKAFTGHEVFCCIGTTKKKTPDNETYRKIDFGIPVAAAKLAKQNNINTIIIISALGADAKSAVFYNKIKGEMENAVIAEKIANTHILQPSLIGGDRSEKRVGEWLFKQVMKVLGFMLVGNLAKYKTIEPETIAKAMLWLANNSYENLKIESDQIKKIGSEYDRNRT